MPTYQIWYRDNEEPFIIDRASRLSDKQIVEEVMERERIALPPVAPAGTDHAVPTPDAAELIAKNGLAPLRYTEDESEMHTIA